MLFRRRWAGWCGINHFSKFLRQMGHTVGIFTASEIHNTNINMIRDSSLYKEQEMETGYPIPF